MGSLNMINLNAGQERQEMRANQLLQDLFFGLWSIIKRWSFIGIPTYFRTKDGAVIEAPFYSQG